MRVSRMMILFLILFLSGIVVTPVLAQTSAQQRAANLRSQMAEVELRQAELQMRLGQLEYDVKPENIERGLAGIGSTRPEELREHRRRQLEREKNYVQAQLNELAASRTRLETAVAQADAEAYRQIVGPDRSNGPMTGQAQSNSTAVSASGVRPVAKRRVVKQKRIRRAVRQ